MLGDIIAFLTTVLIAILLFRLCMAFLPSWLTVLIGLLALWVSGVVQPQAVRILLDALGGPVRCVLPFVVLLAALGLMLTRRTKKKRR